MGKFLSTIGSSRKKKKSNNNHNKKSQIQKTEYPAKKSRLGTVDTQGSRAQGSRFFHFERSQGGWRAIILGEMISDLAFIFKVHRPRLQVGERNGKAFVLSRSVFVSDQDGEKACHLGSSLFSLFTQRLSAYLSIREST